MSHAPCTERGTPSRGARAGSTPSATGDSESALGTAPSASRNDVPVHVVDGLAPDRLADAATLVYEYLALTQVECGGPEPTGPADLPAQFRADCADPAATFAPPGGLLLAYRGDEPIGCVGVLPEPDTHSARISRLYVRAGHRGGVGEALMHAAHRYAARAGFARLALGVMPTRTLAIALYRRLGYRDVDPTNPPTTGLLQMHRLVPPRPSAAD